MDPATRQATAALALDTLRRLGHEDILPYLVIDWSPRFTARMGDAYYGPITRRREQYTRYAHPNAMGDPYIALARFSIPLWPRASEEERRETVVHEIAHLVVLFETYAQGNYDADPHGREWREVMRRAGYPHPSRCHSVDRTGLRRPQRRAVVHCGCGRRLTSPRVFWSVYRGGRLYCHKCGQMIKLYPDRAGRGDKPCSTTYR